ncbi:MAG TPA: AI-2E family transporter [Chitinophagaceae bacterium]|nr:AI-2E family transporter [Chitinophagaceae bacterium]
MLQPADFNKQIKQVMILLLLLFLVLLVLRELYVFFPGLLGALTLYILSRGSYFQLIYHRKWPKGWTAGLFMLSFLILLGLLIYFTVILLEKQVEPFFQNPASSLSKAKQAIIVAQEQAGVTLVSDESLGDLQHRIATLVPSLLNDTLNLLFNLVILLFVFYYMLVHGKEMESFLARIIPLKKTNVDVLATETKRIVKVSALGIPIISLIQGVTATVGYILFGVDEFILWGFFTGVFAFFPVVGTMIIWVPLVIYMYVTGDTWNAVGLAIYSFIVTGNVDYLARITLLKTMGNVHPLVTVIGVIVGLSLFGFIGLIFGPLMVNYVILLFRIYMNEFIQPAEPDSTDT